MEIDLKGDVAYVVIKIGEGLLRYFDLMEGNERIIEKFNGSESDEKLPME